MVNHDVLARARRGDPRAFEEVVRATHRHAYTLAFRLVRDRQDAEDVTQEAYLRAFRALRGFREDAAFETWLYRIVTNAAMTFLRRRGRFGDLAAEHDGPPPEPVSPERSEDQAVDRDSLVRALETLSPALRSVVILKDVYGLSCQEIGEEMGATEGAIKVRLHRARKRLRDALFDVEADGEV
ncbi:MAG TPA: sigma-70 family RNA polymerase sigma factor [Actinomycetota bacterium]|nr:sigma-70 family RNA polymerase sigma factor [Actinomycetota bacterium]